MPKRSQTRRKAKAAGFRSGFEQMIAGCLDKLGVKWEYEPPDARVEYVPKPKKYTPDFVLPNGVIIEVKGRFTVFDRTKHLLIQKQHPDLDIRFVFQYDNKIARNSQTRYSEWCDKHGFKYAFNEVPKEWTE